MAPASTSWVTRGREAEAEGSHAPGGREEGIFNYFDEGLVPGKGVNLFAAVSSDNHNGIDRIVLRRRTERPSKLSPMMVRRVFGPP